jgi:hypothetical protein
MNDIGMRSDERIQDWSGERAARVSRRSVLSVAAAVSVGLALPEIVAMAAEGTERLVVRDGWILRATDIMPVHAR